MTHSLPPLALYIHWPFCKKKCPYCDFNSHVREEVDTARWQRALLRELRTMHAMLAPHQLVSIFFGGGTPSLMPPDISEALISEAHTLWPHDEVEITLEANPTSVEANKFKAFRDAGVNRVSLGVQSLHDEQLQFLGREHSAAEALKAVEIAATTFDRYSFDMIYALPGQTPAMWEVELHEALPHTRGHMSLYQLTIEPNTAFYHAYHVKQDFALPIDDAAVEMYQLTQDIMQDADMTSYEISNHATTGQECRHNLAYWRGEAYVGIGPGAHGRIVNAEGERIATATIKSPERWLEKVESQGNGLEEQETLSRQSIDEERMMMGLRLTEGLSLTDLSQSTIYNGSIEKMCAERLLMKKNSTIFATDSGRLLLNSVLGEILA